MRNIGNDVLRGQHASSDQSEERKTKLVQKAVWLSWFTIIYNVIEGIVSIFYGVEDLSISLFGFGVDSFIEVASAFIVLWRFRGESGLGVIPSIAKERRSTFLIGLLFGFLAASTVVVSVVQLLRQSHPETTVPGVVISTLSLNFMFYLWNAKKKTGIALDSATVMSDASCSLACIKLSGILLMGSTLYGLFPALWWIDSIAAIIIGALIGLEGKEMINASKKETFKGGCCGWER